MGFVIESLQGYTFEVAHGTVTIPEDAPRHPSLPEPGSTVTAHTLRFMDAVFAPDGTMVGVRRVIECDLSDRQCDELVRQLQGGAPPTDTASVLVADAGALRNLPSVDQLTRKG